jgi:hypothetical protein
MPRQQRKTRGRIVRIASRVLLAFGPVSAAAATAASEGATVVSRERPMFHGFIILPRKM